MHYNPEYVSETLCTTSLDLEYNPGCLLCPLAHLSSGGLRDETRESKVVARVADPDPTIFWPDPNSNLIFTKRRIRVLV